MIVTIDEHHILGIEGEHLDTGKEYTLDVQGYRFSWMNKRVFVAHKKEIKLIELKHIGSTMGVFYCIDREEIPDLPLDQRAIMWAGQLFTAWDEEKWEHYSFLPYFPHQKVEETQNILDTLGIHLSLRKDIKGILVEGAEKISLEQLTTLEKILSFFFGLTLLYGKFEARGEQLNSIKIHLPLFGQYLQLTESLEQLVKIVQQQGIFLQISKNEHQGKMSFQMSSNDYELLQVFAIWYKKIENFSQITKKEFALQDIELLKRFVEQEDIENRTEIVDILSSGVIKILVKN